MILLVSPVAYVAGATCARIPACSLGTFAFSGACGGIERRATCFGCDREATSSRADAVGEADLTVELLLKFWTYFAISSALVNLPTLMMWHYLASKSEH